MSTRLPARDNEVLLLILGRRAGGTITITEEEIAWANSQQLGGYAHTAQPSDRSVTLTLLPRPRPSGQ